MWRAAQVRNARGEWTWNRTLRETTRGRWGAYAVRDSNTREVLYVGESSIDSSKRPALRWWKTITRHFQDPTGKFAARKEVTFTAKHPWKYEIALWPASSPDAALRKQADLIARLKPTRNKDDGKAKDEGEGNEEMGAFNFGHNVRSNPGTSTERPTPRGRDGRYADELDKPCVCGRRKGEHDAEPPYAHEDGTCLGFRPSRPSKAERAAAAAEYEDTHWGAPAKGEARALEVVDVTHGRLIELGTLARVDYETTKRGDPKDAVYWHEFEHVRPTLAYHACDRAKCPDRGKLVIAGGSYRVLRHGIVG